MDLKWRRRGSISVVRTAEHQLKLILRPWEYHRAVTPRTVPGCSSSIANSSITDPYYFRSGVAELME